MYKEIKKYFPEAINGDGIFSAIANIKWFPGVNPDSLDQYFILKYGDKLGSSLLNEFTDENGVITGDKLHNLAMIIHNRNIVNWEHEYKTLTVEYNPIENTDYVESVTEHVENNGESSTEADSTTNSSGDKYAFNSETAVHDNKGSVSDDTDTSSSYSNAGDTERTIRKHGNIGVTTNADMIKSDISVWDKNHFYDLLCGDVCDLITLSIF